MRGAGAAVAGPQITITSKQDRPSPREQIDQILERARDKKEPLRIRLPFSLYDYSDSRGYVQVSEAAWNLQLPAEETDSEMVMRLIETIGKCIVAIAAHGSEAVEEQLRGLGDSQ
jgi:hypothetical protein